MAGWQSGSCRGLQILVHRFNSGTGLQIHSLPHLLFRLSSAVEQSAVNRSVACSNQAAGANKKLSGRAATKGSLFGADSWRALFSAQALFRANTIYIPNQ